MLEPFNAEELEALKGIVDRAAESVLSLVTDGPAQAMACYNRAR